MTDKTMNNVQILDSYKNKFGPYFPLIGAPFIQLTALSRETIILKLLKERRACQLFKFNKVKVISFQIKNVFHITQNSLDNCIPI
jgi:hypothetical protein